MEKSAAGSRWRVWRMQDVFTKVRLFHNAEWISARVRPCILAQKAIWAAAITWDWMPQTFRQTVVRSARFLSTKWWRVNRNAEIWDLSKKCFIHFRLRVGVLGGFAPNVAQRSVSSNWRCCSGSSSSTLAPRQRCSCAPRHVRYGCNLRLDSGWPDSARLAGELARQHARRCDVAHAGAVAVRVRRVSPSHWVAWSSIEYAPWCRHWHHRAWPTTWAIRQKVGLSTSWALPGVRLSGRRPAAPAVGLMGARVSRSSAMRGGPTTPGRVLRLRRGRGRHRRFAKFRWGNCCPPNSLTLPPTSNGSPCGAVLQSLCGKHWNGTTCGTPEGVPWRKTWVCPHRPFGTTQGACVRARPPPAASRSLRVVVPQKTSKNPIQTLPWNVTAQLRQGAKWRPLLLTD